MILLYRYAATPSTRENYRQWVDEATAAVVPQWPFLAPEHDWPRFTRDSDGVVFLGPGRGDKGVLTADVVAAIKAYVDAAHPGNDMRITLVGHDAVGYTESGPGDSI